MIRMVITDTFIKDNTMVSAKETLLMILAGVHPRNIDGYDEKLDFCLRHAVEIEYGGLMSAHDLGADGQAAYYTRIDAMFEDEDGIMFRLMFE